MKRLNLMILIIGVAIIFFGCSKNNSMAPDLSQGDEQTSSLKAKVVITHFTGTSNIVLPPIPNLNVWYDVADDSRVTGVSIWVTEGTKVNGNTTKLWGTAELFVGAEEFADVGLGNYDGKWEASWRGTQIMTSDGFRIVAHAAGTGTDGDVLGLTAKWKYTMDFDGTGPPMYVTKGKITETP